MMSTSFPADWVDRRKVIRDNPNRNPPIEQMFKSMSDNQILHGLGHLTVVGVDPGGTTGMSVMQISYVDLVNPQTPLQGAIFGWMHGQVDCGSQSGNAAESATAMGGLGVSETGEAAGVAIIENIICQAAAEPAAVVIEDFIPREFNQSRDFLSPVRITAALNQLLWELRATTQHRQQASEAKTTCTDDRLQKWGFFEGGNSDRHARDADRHALLFLRKLRSKGSRLRAAYPIVTEAESRGLL